VDGVVECVVEVAVAAVAAGISIFLSVAVWNNGGALSIPRPIFNGVVSLQYWNYYKIS
jgi:hypothetical protein